MIRRYGLWDSPITAEFLAEGGLQIEPNFAFYDNEIYFVERRPSAKGEVLVSLNLSDCSERVIGSADFGIRSRVHEYGGVAFSVCEGGVIFVEADSQDIYFCREGDGIVGKLLSAGERRFGDLQFDDKRKRILAVAESHVGGDVINELCFIGLDGKGLDGKTSVAMTGADFYASPCLSADGRRVAWLQWDLPFMAWDRAELWQGEIGTDGGIENAVRIRGGAGVAGESCFQPQYDLSGNLFFICDNEFGFWQLHCLTKDGEVKSFSLQDKGQWVECGLPLWQLGMRTYDFLDNDNVILSGTVNGEWSLYHLHVGTGVWRRFEDNFCNFGGLRCYNGKVYFLATLRFESAQLIELDVALDRELDVALDRELDVALDRELEVIEGNYRLLKSTADKTISKAYISEGVAMKFDEAYGFYYPPQNGDYESGGDEKPPLILRCHGGPTAATDSSFNGKIQFWTSRGFAVCDLNYRGSTGYGRVYRESLYGEWGIFDALDCVTAANYLVRAGLADSERLIISGSSAGGFSALCALTFSDCFKAGCSAYGIGDLTALAVDTHKFESRYLDRLVALYPEEIEVYKARSPLFSAEKITCPILFLQGSDDKIVPPNQMFAMLEALENNGIACEHVLFEGEGHGFRKPENVIRCYDSELAFYRKVFDIK